MDSEAQLPIVLEKKNSQEINKKNRGNRSQKR